MARVDQDAVACELLCLVARVAETDISCLPDPSIVKSAGNSLVPAMLADGVFDGRRGRVGIVGRASWIGGSRFTLDGL